MWGRAAAHLPHFRGQQRAARVKGREEREQAVVEAV
jgi:hypothetical protein